MVKPATLKSRLVKHISIVFIWNNVTKVLGVLATIFLIRMLEKTEYAQYTFFWTALSFFAGLLGRGISTAYVRYAAEEFSSTGRLPGDIFASSLALCLGVSIAAAPFVAVFSGDLSSLLFGKDLYHLPLLLGYVGAIGQLAIELSARYYQVQERYSRAGFLINLERFAFVLFLGGAFVLARVNFIAVACAQIALTLLLGAALLCQVFRKEMGQGRSLRAFSRFQEFLRTSAWLILYTACAVAVSQLDVFMISRMLTSDDLANYGVAHKYYSLMLTMLPSIMTVLRVRTSQADMVRDFRKQKRFVRKWLVLASAAALPAVALIALLSGPAMRLLNTALYDASITPFKILALSAVLSYIFAPNVSTFISLKKYRLLLCFGIAGLSANILANLWLIPVHGIAGAAAATLASHLIINALATAYILTRRAASWSPAPEDPAAPPLGRSAAPGREEGPRDSSR